MWKGPRRSIERSGLFPLIVAHGSPPFVSLGFWDQSVVRVDRCAQSRHVVRLLRTQGRLEECCDYPLFSHPSSMGRPPPTFAGGFRFSDLFGGDFHFSACAEEWLLPFETQDTICCAAWWHLPFFPFFLKIESEDDVQDEGTNMMFLSFLQKEVCFALSEEYANPASWKKL